MFHKLTTLGKNSYKQTSVRLLTLQMHLIAYVFTYSNPLRLVSKARQDSFASVQQLCVEHCTILFVHVIGTKAACQYIRQALVGHSSDHWDHNEYTWSCYCSHSKEGPVSLCMSGILSGYEHRIRQTTLRLSPV